MVTEDALISDEEAREERKRKVKLLAALFLTLLAGLLVLVLLWLLLFRPARPVSVLGDNVLESVFSIYGLSRPFGVSSDEDGNIYVADNGSSRLLVFDKDGNYVRRIGKDKGRSQLFSINGVEVDDRRNRVYVADFGVRQVFVFNKTGKLLFRFPQQPGDPAFGQLRFSPYDVAYYGNRILVSSNDGIYIFNTEGKLMQKWGGKGSDLGFFDFVNGIAVDKRNGDIYVGDVLNRRVVALNPRGEIRWAVGLSDIAGKSRSYFGLPRGVAVDAEGRVFVVDTFNFRVSVLDRDGNLIAIGGKRGVEDGALNFPEGIDIRPDGLLLVADRENNRVEVLRLRNAELLPAPDPEDRVKYNSSLARPGTKGTKPAFVNIIDFRGKTVANEDPSKRGKDESLAPGSEKPLEPGPPPAGANVKPEQ